LNILAFDVETKPATVYTWNLHQPIIGIDQIIDPGGMICFAAKWVGRPGIEFRSDHHDGHETMIQRIWQLLDQCDAVLYFNGDRFDKPVVQREFIERGMTPPSPYKTIDLYKTVRRQGRFISNKLAHIAPQLGLQGKLSHEGFSLWKKCLAGDEAAWAKMRRYNKRDVTLLEDAYQKLLPWITNHPSRAAQQGANICGKCGSHDFESRGYALLRTGSYRRYRCNQCGSWHRSTKRETTTNIVEAA